MLKKARNKIAATRKQLSRKSWKFLLAGDGMSVRTGRFFGESILVGLMTGFVVVAFHFMIHYGTAWIAAWSEGRPRWLLVFLPAVGALLGYLLIKRFDSLEHARGTDSAILAYHRRHGYVPPAVLPVKSTASVLTVASGGSAGYEGPVTLLGASCGSLVASWFGLSARARRILMTAGLSAGIAALFQAPLAGAIFGFEILYSSNDVEYECILPCFIASALSYTIFAHVVGWGTLFTMPPECYENGIRLLPYFVLAIVITFGARFYISFFRATERKFQSVRWNGALKVFLGGLVTGLILLFCPEVFGASYDVIRECLGDVSRPAPWFVLFFFLKVVATSFTVGSGGSGGVFAPAIACGGALGLAVGLGFQQVLPASIGIHPTAFALVGMAGFLASCNRIPITAVVMVAEISGNHGLLLPAMWVCGISFWLNSGWTLYRSQVHNREASPVHRL